MPHTKFQFSFPFFDSLLRIPYGKHIFINSSKNGKFSEVHGQVYVYLILKGCPITTRQSNGLIYQKNISIINVTRYSGKIL